MTDPDGVQAGQDEVREPRPETQGDRWRPHPENETSIAVVALAGMALVLMLLHGLWELATDVALLAFDAVLKVFG